MKPIHWLALAALLAPWNWPRLKAPIWPATAFHAMISLAPERRNGGAAMGRKAIRAIILALALAPMSGAFAWAMPPWLAKAQGMGFQQITGCTSCHTEGAEKKSEREKGGIGFNDRGAWLLKTKEECSGKSSGSLPSVSLEWLKDDPFAKQGGDGAKAPSAACAN